MAARPAGRKTSLLEVPGGVIEVLTTGSGLPATVFAHGLTGSIETTRPFGSGVSGSRTFMHFQGYGASSAAQAQDIRPTYAALALELRAVADHVGATQALGVSMGAGALCSLLARTPLRFERLVLVMPAVLDRARSDAALDRLGTMTRRALPGVVALKDRAVLAAVTAPVLVIAQEDDPVHPVWVAEALAAILPHCRLEVMGPATPGTPGAPGGLLWCHRDRLRELIGGFLSALPAQRLTPASQTIGGSETED